MSSLPVPESGALARGRAQLRCCALLVTLVVAGCSPGGLPSTSPSTSPSTATSFSPSATSVPPATSNPSERPDPQVPPTATLTAADGIPIAGALGSYTWDGAGSDSPWLVPPKDQAVHRGGPYALAFDPATEAERWRASWAPVRSGTAGDPAGTAEGVGAPAAVPGPGRPGIWSLQVDVRFAGGGHAAWYWRVVIAP